MEVSKLEDKKTIISIESASNDCDDCNEDLHNSWLNTPNSSCQTSPKNHDEYYPLKKEDCYEIIFGGKEIEDGSSRFEKISKDLPKLNSVCDEVNENLCLEETKNLQLNSTPRKSTKSERKQRLCVRTDDSDDIIFDEIDYVKNESKIEKKYSKKMLFYEEEELDIKIDRRRSSNNTSPANLSKRLAESKTRRKRAVKKVFDPSDHNVVKKKRGRYANIQKVNSLQESIEPSKCLSKEIFKDSNRLCSICSEDKPDSIIGCRDCTVRAHPTCIYTSEELFHKSLSSWQCKRCKTCTVCFETSDLAPLVTCYGCDDAYHYSCHTPRVTGCKSKWHCCNCNHKPIKSLLQNSNSSTSSFNNNFTEIHANAQILPPVLSPQVSPNRNLEDMEDNFSDDIIDPNIPDASEWTSEQVYQYFARLFPKEAEIFRSQDIDGHSLLLLKRSDVLGGLDLLLGPALKIYRHVLKLQVRRDDSQLYWL